MTIPRDKTRLALAAGVLTTSLVLAGCCDGMDYSDLRVIHASKDAPPINLRVGFKNQIEVSSARPQDSRFRLRFHGPSRGVSGSTAAGQSDCSDGRSGKPVTRSCSADASTSLDQLAFGI